MMRIKVTSYRDAGEESASRYGSVKATYLSLLLFDLVALALLVLSLLVDAFTVFLSAFLLLALLLLVQFFLLGLQIFGFGCSFLSHSWL